MHPCTTLSYVANVWANLEPLPDKTILECLQEMENIYTALHVTVNVYYESSTVLVL